MVAMLSAYLKAPPRRKDKAPDGFDTQLKATCEATTRNVPVILLEAGFQAWYAYLVANTEACENLAALSHSQIQEVAKELCKIEPHSEIKEHFQHLFYGSDRADYRYRKCTVGLEFRLRNISLTCFDRPPHVARTYCTGRRPARGRPPRSETPPGSARELAGQRGAGKARVFWYSSRCDGIISAL